MHPRDAEETFIGDVEARALCSPRQAGDKPEYLATGSKVSFQMRASLAKRAHPAGLPSYMGIMFEGPPLSMAMRALFAKEGFQNRGASPPLAILTEYLQGWSVLRTAFFSHPYAKRLVKTSADTRCVQTKTSHWLKNWVGHVLY